MCRFNKHCDLEENKPKCILIHSVIKLMKANDEEKILKVPTKNQFIIYRVMVI